MSQKELGVDFDYAIVGGGPAGMYAAMRFQEEGKNWALFEAGESCTGRLLSIPRNDPKPGSDATSTDERQDLRFASELGGMRFMERQHLVMALVKHLGLSPLVTDHHFPVAGYFARGELIAERSNQPLGRADFSARVRHVFHMNAVEAGCTPAELILRVIDQVVQATVESLASLSQDDSLFQDRRTVGLQRAISISEVHSLARELRKPFPSENHPLLNRRAAEIYRRFAVVARDDGPPLLLDDVTFWHLLGHYLSGEAFQFVQAGFGYFSILGDWSAAEAIPWFLADFAATGYKTIDYLGMSALQNGMRNKASGGAKSSFFTSHALTHIRWDSAERVFTLIFRTLHGTPTKHEGKPWQRDEAGTTHLDHILAQRGLNWCTSIRCKNLLLAIPPAPLQHIVFEKVPLRECRIEDGSLSTKIDHFGISALCSKLQPRPLQKIVLDLDGQVGKVAIDHKISSQPSATDPRGGSSEPSQASPIESRAQARRGTDPASAYPGHTRILSDVHLRQVFIQSGYGVNQSTVMVYADGASATGLEQIRQVETKRTYEDGDDADFIKLPPAIAGQAGLALPLRVEQKVREQLAAILACPLSSIPITLTGAMKTWTEWPIGAGWWSFEPHASAFVARAYCVQPAGYDCPLAIAGDAYSCDSGWVAGAFASSERALRQKFQLQPAPWQPQSITDAGVSISFDEYLDS